MNRNIHRLIWAGASATFLLVFLMMAAAPATAAITSPLDISGHVLWLDGADVNGDSIADSGTGSVLMGTWTDKSSGQGDNSVTVTAGAPTQVYNARAGQSAVRFTVNSQDKLDNNTFSLSSDPDGYTIVTVVDPTLGGKHILSGLNQAGTDPVLFTTGTWAYNFYDGGATNIAFAGNGVSGYHLVGVQVDPAADVAYFDDLTLTGFGDWGSAPLDGIRIGNLDRDTPSSTNRAEAWGGDIAEVIIYDRALTAGEMADLSDYLTDKWNLWWMMDGTGAATLIETNKTFGGTPSWTYPTENTYGLTNAALDGTGFGKNYIVDAGRSFRPSRVSDGLYSDLAQGNPPVEEPWIGSTADSFVGVKLAGPTTIDMIGFQNEFSGRRDGKYVLQYTTDSLDGIPTDPDLGLDPGLVDGLNWQTIDALTITGDAIDTRRLYQFAPIAGVTAVRLGILSTGGQVGLAELEVWQAGTPTPPQADTIVFETIDTVVFDPAQNPDSFNFPTIGRPSATDYADQNSGNGVVVSIAPGSAAGIHGNSAPVTALNDGIIMDAPIDCCGVSGGDPPDPMLGPNDQRDAFFFDDVYETGRVLMTFPEAIEIEKIVTFVGIDDCCLNRAEQQYVVYGTLSDSADTSGNLAENSDWVWIATVEEPADNQTAVMLTDSDGSLGVYKQLIFEMFPGAGSNVHEFYGEIDVYAVPEPGGLSLVLLAAIALGSLGWIRKKRFE